MTDPTPLSPAAQNVSTASEDAQSRYWELHEQDPEFSLCESNFIAAAALRTAADRVVPDDPQEAMHFTTEAIRLNKQGIRCQLLGIAAELEGAR